MSDLIDDILNDLDNAISDHLNHTENSSSSAFTNEEVSAILEENGFPNIAPVEVPPDNLSDMAVEFALNNSSVVTSLSNEAENTEENDTSASSEDSESQSKDNSEEESLPSEGNALPLNSPTLLMDDSTSRFSGTEWYNEIKKQRIIIAGIGGIGSNAAYQLARMSLANITLYDNDTVEAANMSGQFFSYDDVRKSKVDAIADRISNYTTTSQVNAIKDNFTNNTEPGDIMICGFDSMSARRGFFASWAKHVSQKSEEEKSKCLYIDGRLSIDTLQVFCIRGDDAYNKNRYKKNFLFLDSEADATVCSMKQTTYLACMIGSIITNLFTNFVADTLNPVIPYDLPFFTEYDAQNMIFKTEN